MSKLSDAIWVEKYRPQNFNDLIFSGKEELKKMLSELKSIPSLIFYSSSPGTGKTSTAKLIAKELQGDIIVINASDERGIDTIRDKVKSFAGSMSFNSNSKRCIFLDEADGLTKQAQEAMKVILEEYSKNCFFIFSCNDISKIEEPIKSRCAIFNFEKPDKKEIKTKLLDICSKEKLIDSKINGEDVEKLVHQLYPDIRKMVCELQRFSLTGKLSFETEFANDIKELKAKNKQHFYDGVFEHKLDMDGFVLYLFRKIWESSFNPKSTTDPKKLTEISKLIAQIEMAWQNKANKEIMFLTNISAIIDLL